MHPDRYGSIALPSRNLGMGVLAIRSLLCLIMLVLWTPLALLLLTERPQRTAVSDQPQATSEMIADEDYPVLEPES